MIHDQSQDEAILAECRRQSVQSPSGPPRPKPPLPATHRDNVSPADPFGKPTDYDHPTSPTTHRKPGKSASWQGE
jgi:hypothetical protein